jgi:elongation factor Ts
MASSAEQVKDLRERTGAGVMDCKAALEAAQGDLQGAVEYLRKKGLADAAKKSHRDARDGVVGSYIHPGSKIGVLVEVNCETDFAARNADFQNLVKDVAMHICAQAPRYVRRDEIPAEELQKEREIYAEQVRASGTPAHLVDKIVEGKLESYYQMTCLYDQAFVKEPGQTVQQLIEALVGKIGENIRVRRFARFQTGEGLEKRSTDLAADVQAALGGQ